MIYQTILFCRITPTNLFEKQSVLNLIYFLIKIIGYFSLLNYHSSTGLWWRLLLYSDIS